MKEVTVRVAGQEIPLYYNGYAMYAVRDLLGEEKIYDVLAQDTPEAFEKTCEIASILATQGELYRRYIGMDKGRILSAQVLRIALLAEPLYGVSIVAAGALRGTGDTFVPSLLNLGSIWVIRLGLAVLLITPLGLRGMWIAMAVELCIRGLLLLYRQHTSKYYKIS